MRQVDGATGMLSPWPWRIVVAATVALILTITRASGAQGDAPVSDVDEEQARILFEKAVQAYDEGKLNEALTLMRNSYQKHPVPIVLYNLAMVELESGDWTSAGNHLHTYLETEANLTGDRRIEIAQVIENDIRPHAGLIQVKGIEVGALVLVDGTPIGDAGIRYGWWVLAGEHEVSLPEGSSKTVDVAEGEAVLVELTRPKEKKSMLPGYLVGGIGLVAAATGSVFMGIAATNAGTVENAAPATPWTDVKDEFDKSKKYPVVGGILLGVGGAALVTGASLLIATARKNKNASPATETQPSVSLVVAPDVVGIALGGTF